MISIEAQRCTQIDGHALGVLRGGEVVEEESTV